MLELADLAALGRSAQTLGLPLAAWTAVALVAEAALRLGRAPAALGLPVRGAVLAALPVSLLAPTALSALAPAAVVEAVTTAGPTLQWLPEVAVGAAPTAPAGPVLDGVGLGLGIAVVAGLAAGAWQLVRLGRALLAVQATRRTLSPASPVSEGAVAEACAALGVDRPIAAAQAPEGVAPFTVGWRRPVVALPPLPAPARDVAALHEVAHVRRADFAWHAAQRAVQAVFAAHPLVWVLGRGLDLDRERAADALVVGARPAQRRAYADLLLSYAALPPPALALGAAPGSSSVKSRIDAMASPLSPRQSRRLARAGRLAGLVAVALITGIAATNAPQPSVADDPLIRHVDRVEVWRTADGPPTARVYLRPSAPAGTASALADEFGDATGDIAFTIYGETTPLTFAGSPGALGPRRLGQARLLSPLGPAFSVARDTTEVYDVVDEMPELIGGLEGVQERLEYPELQRRAGVEGRAILQFVVTEAGAITDLRVERSSGNDGLDRAALAAVRGSRFTPGRHRGEPVKVRFVLPVTFRTGDAPVPAQREPGPPPEIGDGQVMEVVDDQPELIGGLAGLQSRVVYPPLAREAGIEGMVVVQFIVTEEGRVEDAVAVRSPDDMLSEAALRAVRASEFEPGRHRGVPVRVRFAVPITFRLPSGGGEDQGALPRSRSLRYAGVDLDRITPVSRDLFLGTMDRTAARLDAEGQTPGDIELTYTIRDDGRPLDIRYVRGDESLSEAARFLVGVLRTAEDARPGPGASWTGTFRLRYVGRG